MRCHCNHQKSQLSPRKEIVYPTKEEVVKTYSEETVQHIHPSHTTVVNCHTVKNEHLYPHTTSYENVTNEIDLSPNHTGVAGVSDNMCGSYYGGSKCGSRRRRRRFF